ncbi:MAG: DUF6152 family protein [Gammaproteobacteria bacterium]|nr:DUF6152 family protein [Gammaproteobacteria bacterium]
MKIVSAALFAVVALSGTSALAHHAFGAEFDPNRPLILKGKVVKVEWVNPHAWIHLEHEKEDGTTEKWMVEGGTPNTLLRRGITRNSLKPGTKIVVDGYQSKDRSKRANGRNITYDDGRTLFMGSSGTGAPRDGADPTERATDEDQERLEQVREEAEAETEPDSESGDSETEDSAADGDETTEETTDDSAEG